VFQIVSLWGMMGKEEVSNIDATDQLVLKMLLNLIVYLGVIINILFRGVWVMVL
jgi:hypothetical protein